MLGAAVVQPRGEATLALLGLPGFALDPAPSDQELIVIARQLAGRATPDGETLAEITARIAAAGNTSAVSGLRRRRAAAEFTIAQGLIDVLDRLYLIRQPAFRTGLARAHVRLIALAAAGGERGVLLAAAGSLGIVVQWLYAQAARQVPDPRTLSITSTGRRFTSGQVIDALGHLAAAAAAPAARLGLSVFEEDIEAAYVKAIRGYRRRRVDGKTTPHQDGSSSIDPGEETGLADEVSRWIAEVLGRVLPGGPPLLVPDHAQAAAAGRAAGRRVITVASGFAHRDKKIKPTPALTKEAERRRARKLLLRNYPRKNNEVRQTLADHGAVLSYRQGGPGDEGLNDHTRSVLKKIDKLLDTDPDLLLDAEFFGGLPHDMAGLVLKIWRGWGGSYDRRERTIFLDRLLDPAEPDGNAERLRRWELAGSLIHETMHAIEPQSWGQWRLAFPRGTEARVAAHEGIPSVLQFMVASWVARAYAEEREQTPPGRAGAMRQAVEGALADKLPPLSPAEVSAALRKRGYVVPSQNAMKLAAVMGLEDLLDVVLGGNIAKVSAPAGLPGGAPGRDGAGRAGRLSVHRLPPRPLGSTRAVPARGQRPDRAGEGGAASAGCRGDPYPGGAIGA